MKRTCAREGALVSEADRNGQITLAVDQEVFIETVEQDHTVDDANVATEVTSFERVGDAYVLEGAIVFAGYLTKAKSGEGAGQDPASVNQYARHVHHRMPFTLRVPVQFQPRGVVNVASRISDWKLDVISEGWLRVQAKLRVSGLNGKRGYHFQCGAQEDGDVLFGNGSTDSDATDGAEVSVEAVADSRQAVDDGQDETTSGTEQLENSFELVRGQPDEGFTRDAAEEQVNRVERVSEARGGVDESTHATQEPVPVRDAAQQESVNRTPTNASVREELLALDRHVRTESMSDEPTSSPGDEKHAPLTAGVSSVDDAAETSEFEFAHQVDLSKVPVREPRPPESGHVREQSGEVTGEESFVASRSFSENGFQATAGFVPTVHVGAQAEDSLDEEETVDDSAQESNLVRTVDTSLWSFVDFNAPDNYYTLRYVIVMDEESLPSLAARVGCSEGDLMRANRLTGESVEPGQVLKVPGGLMIPSS
jgi:LysM repeat protein